MGTATITCTLTNGYKKSTKVTVAKNEHVIKNIDYKSATTKEMHLFRSKVYFSGNNIVLELVAYNNTDHHITMINTLTFEIVYDDVTIAKKTFKNMPFDVAAYGKKSVVFTIPCIKKIDLRTCKYVFSGNGSFQYNDL